MGELAFDVFFADVVPLRVRGEAALRADADPGAERWMSVCGCVYVWGKETYWFRASWTLRFSTPLAMTCAASRILCFKISLSSSCEEGE